MNNKQFTVFTGTPYPVKCHTVNLAGILPDAPLTPKMARQAAQAAVGGPIGGGDAVTVWDDGDYGYRIYADAARKIQKQQ